MITEQKIVEKIEKILQDNKELLNRDLTTVAEDPQTHIRRAIAIVRLNELYGVLGKFRPIFKCEKTRGER